MGGHTAGAIDWAAIFDLMMSEYGGTPDQIASEWSPAQVVVMADAICRRRAGRLAEAAVLNYNAIAAAFAGGQAFEQLQKQVGNLERAANPANQGDGGAREDEATAAAKLAHGLGLRFVDHDQERRDHSADDSGPAD